MHVYVCVKHIYACILRYANRSVALSLSHPRQGGHWHLTAVQASTLNGMQPPPSLIPGISEQPGLRKISGASPPPRNHHTSLCLDPAALNSNHFESWFQDLARDQRLRPRSSTCHRVLRIWHTIITRLKPQEHPREPRPILGNNVI